MAENPALKPTATAVEGDNLTANQASLLLACLEADPNGVLEEAEKLGMTEDDVDGLIQMLSDMGGEEEDETGDDEEEAGSDDETEVTE